MRSSWIKFWMLVAVCAVNGWAEAPEEAPKARTGPRLHGFGPVFDVPEPDFVTGTERDYRAVFDVARAPDEPDRVNPSIETLARFLNMHKRAGVPDERIHVALVLHGSAAKAALEDDAYRKRHNVDNPNQELLQALRAAGVRIVLCGQSAASRGFERAELAAPVELALSAMTALITLQSDGYELIAF